MLVAHRYRFFGSPQDGARWSLDDEEVTHALKVLRLESGAEIEVMNGKGEVCVARLVVTSKSKAHAEVVSTESFPEDTVERAILLGALKPGDIDELIAPLVEMGVDRLIVFRQDDTPQFRVSDQAGERWQRLVRAAVKQSKRPWTAVVEVAEGLEEAVAMTRPGAQKWYLDPDAETDLITLTTELREPVSFVALVGGEKGLSRRESELAHKNGFIPVRLGPWVLRAKTAAVGAAVFLGMLPRQSGR
jgi:16S rRNA (uracil1498-N3)-methyltransferase